MPQDFILVIQTSFQTRVVTSTIALIEPFRRTLKGSLLIYITTHGLRETEEKDRARCPEAQTRHPGAQTPPIHPKSLHLYGSLFLPLVSRDWKNGSNSSYNCTPFLHSLLTRGKYCQICSLKRRGFRGYLQLGPDSKEKGAHAFSP